MRIVRLASEIDFAGWRDAARALRAEGVAPEAVVWTVDGSCSTVRRACGGAAGKAPDEGARAFTVPAPSSTWPSR
jgi:hypothetical protein